jgi:signal transduction histidine kinase/CHASE1-domain containing sensor protein
VVLAALVAVLGLIASMGAGAVLAAEQRDAAGQQLDRRAMLMNEAVTSETDRYVDTLRTVAAAAGAFEPLTAAKFAQIAHPLRDMRLAGATSLAYLVPVASAEIAQTQALWRARGVPDLVLDRQATLPEHIFSVFSQPLDGRTAPRTGIDVTQSASPTQAMREARRTVRVTVSDAYQLIIDQNLPPDQRQMSVSLTAPVYGPPDAAGQRAFRGWVLMGLRGQDFIGTTLARSSQNLVDVTVHADNLDGQRVTMATLRAGAAGRRDLSRSVEIKVADRTWRLLIRAHGAALPGGSNNLPTVVVLAGTVLSLILAGLVHVLATGRARAQAQVRAATVDLAVAEVRARRQAGLLTAVLDSISDGVGVVDEFGEFLVHNPAARTMLGVDDMGGTENWQAHYGLFASDGTTPFPTADLPSVRALAGEHCEQVPIMIRNETNPHGRVVSVSARPLRDDGGQRGAVSVFHDITDRARAECELAETTARLRDELTHRHDAEVRLRAAHDDLATQKAYLAQVLDAIDITVMTCGSDGAIVHANHAARARLGGGDDGAGPHLTLDDGSPLAAADTPLRRSLQGENIDGMEIVVTGPEGTREVLMTHSRPLRHVDGHIIGAVASSYDITALREREAELAAFAGIVAHDLKSPLTTIAGYTEIVQADLAHEPAWVDHAGMLDRVLSTTRRMRRLVDDLLTYAAARDGALTTSDVELHGLVDEVVTERLASITAETGTPAPQIYVGALPVARGDAAMLRQLVDNLLGNALKYTPPGQAAHVDITAQQDRGGVIRVEVADRGIGIPNGQHHAIFADFHRAHHDHGYAGTGLGLAICQRIITRHGGTIGVSDNPGGGARFWFTLPATHHPVRGNRSLTPILD